MAGKSDERYVTDVLHVQCLPIWNGYEDRVSITVSVGSGKSVVNTALCEDAAAVACPSGVLWICGAFSNRRLSRVDAIMSDETNEEFRPGVAFCQ